jgi:hypothetical protein
MVISDGPKPEYAEGNDPASHPPTPVQENPGDNTTTGSPNDGSGTTDDSSDETHAFNRIITIKQDGLGTRQVRVEFEDAQGPHDPILDEPHGEGDKIPVKFEYQGKKITLRVFYDNVVKLELKGFDPQKQRKKQIQGSGGNG